MVHLGRTNQPAKTPIERIFEKVALRAMTYEEREALELNTPRKTRRESGLRRPGLSRKNRESAGNFDAAN